ncbi:MAG: hypothetical protein R3B09_09390 [Nannocystaceae bacterium]
MEAPRPDSIDEREPSWWQIAIALVAWILRAPLLAGPQIARYWRYQRIASKAEGWRGRLTDDGLEVWQDGDRTPRRLGWELLKQARWVERSEYTMASGWEEAWVMEVPGTGVALSDNGLLGALYQALDERFGRPPTLLDGGGDSGGIVLALIWAAILALALWIALAGAPAS